MIDYYEYIESPEWDRKRKKIKERDEYKCMVCGESTNLQVHHNTYERLGHEKPSDLLTVCRDCHVEITAFLKRRKSGHADMREVYENRAKDMLIGLTRIMRQVRHE